MTKYNYQLQYDINNFDDDILFFKKTSNVNIIDKYKFERSESNSDIEYISIHDKNFNFNSLPTYKISINPQNMYRIDFLGDCDSTINIDLFILSFSNTKKLNIEIINFNQSILFNPLDSCKSLRLFLRVKGYGKFSINSLKISKQLKMEFMSFTEKQDIALDAPSKLKDIRVACIFDDFTMECFKDSCSLIPVSPDKFEAELIKTYPHLLIVESAWFGNKGIWNKKICGKDENNLRELKNLTAYCKEKNIPTVFWNKEDPVHYSSFILACKYFDYIFTTDKNSISNYKRDLNHQNVYDLMFACQPKIHNPIKHYQNRLNKCFFAGSYYNASFDHRKIDFENIIKASIDTFGVDIYDRNYKSNNQKFAFPNEYEDLIIGSVKPEHLNTIYKKYKIMLNVNSVKNSPTMFSRRVFEGVASLSVVVSSYSLGIKNVFNDLVFNSDDYDELINEFKLLKDLNYYEKKCIKGLRLCLENHTYNNRLEYILEKANISINKSDPSVSVISIINTESEFNNLIKSYNNQIYKHKNLIIFLSDDNVYNSIKNNNLYSTDNIILIKSSDNLELKDITINDYISIFNHNNFYGKYYLSDLMNATKYTDAEFIGKKTYYYKTNLINKLSIDNMGMEFEYVNSLDLDKSIFIKDIIDNLSFNQFINYINQNEINQFKFGYRYFSIDKYNFAKNFINIDQNKSNIIEI